MKYRSKEKEWMDLGPTYYTAEEYAACLRILFKVSSLFGFFRETRRLLRRFSAQSTLVDVGCGGGLFLLNLSTYFPQMTLLGIDVSAAAIEQAQDECIKRGRTNVHFSLQEKVELDLALQSVDVVLTTLVCHHMDDADLIVFLKAAYGAARKAVIINDLHRHSWAYWFYQRISPWLFRNRLITHDGLISIQRSFIRSEWHALLKQATISNYQIKWCFPFRWRVILWKS